MGEELGWFSPPTLSSISPSFLHLMQTQSSLGGPYLQAMVWEAQWARAKPMPIVGFLPRAEYSPI